ncbi:outer membrane beta-barrel protein [Hymenobacter endophyticus]|uniref:Outer membrane beta-barrel protein n=1 Tax=Hymenobacter endophyticus TaxID=3076335 RepID=A0ABU3TFK3_9BACT|nr:outer membrane beta-barrel protein [Hymenobacter endophyticus]MDU0370151.1 outer membrane beta-barrel protein [Hymenobacter endophyticus]
MITLLYSCLLMQPTALAASPVDTARHTYRAYISIGMNIGHFYDFRLGKDIGKNPQLSPSLTAGIQLRPRFALEVGGLTTTTQSQYSYSYMDYSPDRTTYTVNFEDGTTFRRYYILPVLARYTVASSEDTKLDLLTGATIFHTREKAEITRYNSMREATEQRKTSEATTAARFMLGLGVQFRLTPRVQLATEARTNPRLIIGPHSGSEVLLPLNMDISVRYCFGATQSLPTARSAAR